MNLTDEQIRELARVERHMDAGEQPYVILKGERMPVDSKIMDRFDLVSGQQVGVRIGLSIGMAIVENARAEAAKEHVDEALENARVASADPEKK